MFTSLSVLRMLVVLVGGMMLCGAAGSFSSASDNLFKKRYTIESGSRLYLNGTTNVNSFTCHCEDQFGSRYAELENRGWQTRFRDANLKLPWPTSIAATDASKPIPESASGPGLSDH